MKTVMLQSTANARLLKSEIALHRKVSDHVNVCQLFETFVPPEGGAVHIVMELCTGGDIITRLADHPDGFAEGNAATLLEKMLSAVAYIHAHGVVHRDLKLENWVFDGPGPDAELKLIDFGVAFALHAGHDAIKGTAGTLEYMAPETLGGVSWMVEYDSSVDLWALGVIAYQLLCGHWPFEHADQRSLVKMIRGEPLRFPHLAWAHVSADATDFCSLLLNKEPKCRPNAVEASQHRWIQQRSDLSAVRRPGDTDAAHMLEQHREISGALQAFAAASALKKLSLQAVALSTSAEKLKRLRQLFVAMDTDNSGTIDLDEFRRAMGRQPELSAAQVEHIPAAVQPVHRTPT